MSFATNGSIIKDVFPVPEPPTTNNDWYLAFSTNCTFFPVSKSLQTYKSHVNGPWPCFVSLKLIPL